MKQQRGISTGTLIKRFFPYFKKYKGILFLDLLCAAFTTLCEIILPQMVQIITERAIDDIATLTTRLILILGGVYILLRIIDTVANYYMESVGHIMGAKIETDMRRDLFNHLHTLDHTFYDNTKVGTLMSRISNDLFDVTEFAHHCPEEFFIAGVKIIASFVILSFANIWLTIIVFAVLPIMFWCAMHFNGKMKQGFMESRRQVGELNAQAEDSLLGVRVVKSFANEDIEEKKFAKGNEKFLSVKSKVYHIMAMFHSSTRLFDGIMYIVVVICGAFFIKAGTLTAPEFMAFMLYANMMLNSIRRLVQFAQQFQSGLSGVERFVEIMDTKPEIVDQPDAVPIKDVKGHIQFSHVDFKYASDEKTILHDINLDIPAGTNLAIVGPSGAGKTTICNLIPRFYEPTSGIIYIDGKDIQHVTMESLRDSIGIVQQDVYLFYGTVAENIEYGRPGATQEEIEEAAKKAGAHEFILGLPNGYQTYVGERGVKLSGGQKQRISIARVFLKNPPILILDEATSSLDNQSERIVQRSLELLAKGRTTLTIAHRLTTIQNADLIVFLDETGVREMGTHQELMEKKGFYYQLYNR